MDAQEFTSTEREMGDATARGTPRFGKKNCDIYFPPEAAQDFPVAMQISNKYNMIFIVTKARLLPGTSALARRPARAPARQS